MRALDLLEEGKRMRMKKSTLRRLGKDITAESSLASSLLLIAVTVAAAGLIYPWVMSMMGSTHPKLD